MAELAVGAAAFGLLALGDIGTVKWRREFMRCLFFGGCAMLGLATASLAVGGLKWPLSVKAVCFLICSLLCFAALIYALFFALPFHGTYIEREGCRTVCRTGLYGLCRHPGVAPLCGMYFCLWLAAPTSATAAAAVLFPALDIAYSAWQDACIFPVKFCDYEQYRSSVPFIVPRF